MLGYSLGMDGKKALERGGAAALLADMPERLARIVGRQVAALEAAEPASTPLEADRVLKAAGSAARSTRLILELEAQITKTLAAIAETETLVRAALNDTKATDMDDDGNPTTADELAEYNRWLGDQLGGSDGAPEQKAFGNRARRRRDQAVAKRVGRPSAPRPAGA